MSRVIYKYPVYTFTGDPRQIDVPKGSIPRAVQHQRGVAVAWIELDLNAECFPHTLEVYGTGYMMPDNPGAYCGTFQEGQFVWHVYLRETL